MRIGYENTIEDLVAFTHYHSAHSPSVRRAIFRNQCYTAVAFSVILGLAAFGGAAEREPVTLAGFAVLIAAYIIVTPRVVRWRTARQARRLYAESANKGVVGPHELELIGDELIERTPANELRTKLRSVERVVTDNGYTFIYLSVLSAHVIPHEAVMEGDLAVFLKALKDRLRRDGTQLDREPDW